MSEIISFKNDYSEGAHPAIIQALSEDNLVQQPGYGYDDYCVRARQYIQSAIHSAADVYFVSGGTQANLLAIGHLLRPYESVIATEVSHIEEHETGAIEAVGHKINLVPHKQGKLTPEDVLHVVLSHDDEHRVKPRIIFISLATELGTVYTRQELLALAAVAKEHKLLLYIDGARMAMALASHTCDWTLDFLPQVADAFYIGGTKNGALLGEALVFVHPEQATDFAYYRKQRGALLAKGRTLGKQFEAFFEASLYTDLGAQAVKSARSLAQFLADQGVDFKYPIETNQLFPVLHRDLVAHLESKFSFHIWETEEDDSLVIRLVTSWATRPEHIQAFKEHYVDYY